MISRIFCMDVRKKKKQEEKVKNGSQKKNEKIYRR